VANELTFKVIRSVIFGAVQVGGVQETVLADLGVPFSKQIPANTTNGEADIVVTVANVKAAALVADKDCTIKTNSTSAPDNTFAMKANQPLIWAKDDPIALFLTVNLTKLFITTGAAATIVKFVAAVDATPVINP
jgi:hypothetical protein